MGGESELEESTMTEGDRMRRFLGLVTFRAFTSPSLSSSEVRTMTEGDLFLTRRLARGVGFCGSGVELCFADPVKAGDRRMSGFSSLPKARDLKHGVEGVDV